jgi:hypothetical protein
MKGRVDSSLLATWSVATKIRDNNTTLTYHLPLFEEIFNSGSDSSSSSSSWISNESFSFSYLIFTNFSNPSS